MGKLFFIISSLGPGGAERVASMLVNEISQSNEVFLVTKTAPASFFYKITEEVVTRPILNQSRLRLTNNLRYVYLLCRLFEKEKPDRVISFMPETNILTILSSIACFLLFKVKVYLIISERVDPREHVTGRITAIARRFLYRYADRLVIQTPNLIEWGKKNIREDKISVISNPINRLTFEPLNIEFEFILAVGRLTHQKGHDILLNSFQSVSKIQPQLRLIIIGSGILKSYLIDLCIDLQISEKVIFVEESKNVYSYMKACKLFVLSSRYEGFPNALLEALSLGVVSISFDCNSGPSELLKFGMEKYLVKNINPSALAGKILHVLADTKAKEEFENYKFDIQQKYELKSIANMWLKV